MRLRDLSETDLGCITRYVNVVSVAVIESANMKLVVLLEVGKIM